MNPHAEVSVLVGTRCPRQIDTEFVHDFERWWALQDEVRVEPVPERTPYRLDWSMSRLIEKFRRSTHNWLLIQDTDTFPDGYAEGDPPVPFPKCVAIAEENRLAGFGMSATIAQNVTSGFYLQPMPEREADQWTKIRFEVRRIGAGQWWISREAALALVPVDFMRYYCESGDAAPPAPEPLYCIFGQEYGEDIDLCIRFREVGQRICADRRLLTAHKKGLKRPSLRFTTERLKYRVPPPPPNATPPFHEGDVGGHPQP
jgi:hypothetical protein